MRKLEEFKNYENDITLSKEEMWIVSGGKAIDDASKYSCTQATCVDNCSDLRHTITRDNADGTTTIDKDTTTMSNDDC